MSDDFAIETSGLTKRFGERTALDGVDLRVPRGCAFGFLGPNGAGKTTMIRTLLGLTHASAGSMHLLGHPVPAERAQALRRVGAIVEEPRFHMHLSGRENLRIVSAVRGPETAERIDPALARVGLSERAGEKVKSYSMGMRQRLGVARCLLADPLLLILDEPTNGLDPAGIQEFREMIRAMIEQEGRTVFLSSHLLDEVEKILRRRRDRRSRQDRHAGADRGDLPRWRRRARRTDRRRGRRRAGAANIGRQHTRAGGAARGWRPACGPQRPSRHGRERQRDARARRCGCGAPGAGAPQPRAALP